MEAYVAHEEGTAQIAAALLQGSLEGRTREKDPMTGVLDRLPYLEVVLDENFHKQLEEVSNLQVLVLVGELNCHNIFWKILACAMSNVYTCNTSNHCSGRVSSPLFNHRQTSVPQF